MSTGAALAGLAELGARIARPRVDVDEQAAGRCTGWRVKCSDPEHGTMPVLAPSRKAGVLAGVTHLEHEHDHVGDVFVKGRLVSTSRRGKPATAGYEDADRATRRAVGVPSTSGSSWHSKRKAGSFASRRRGRG